MRPARFEAQLLHRAELILAWETRQASSTERHEFRLQLLEAAASRLSGLHPMRYWRAFGIDPVFARGRFERSAEALAEALATCGISPALAISTLAREPLDESEQRNSGAYYTDFRLARHLAASFEHLRCGMKVLDPAAGAGILLLALTEQAISAEVEPARWIAESVFAADLSAQALRAARCGFLSITSDLGALTNMAAQWRIQDSLVVAQEGWQDIAPGGFDVLVANPPWEKVKLSRHEFLKREGVTRNYGTDYQALDDTAYEARKAEISSYGAALVHRFATMRGEPDLYVAFTELLLELARPGGEIGLIVPAGLIRSQGTAAIRERLMREAEAVRLEVLENRARFFEIDSRFKFLVARVRRRSATTSAEFVELQRAWGEGVGIRKSTPVHMPTEELRRVRRDLSVPEVRSEAEWQIFTMLCNNGEDWSDPQSSWHPQFMREVDMTRDRPAFTRTYARGRVPLIEGRMVHQHRFGVKSYQGGSGRSAKWTSNPLGQSIVEPQFWLNVDRIPAPARRRVERLRAGFCDITGQTNERSMLAAAVPAGVVCGNKVPTVLFPHTEGPERVWLWLAIVNSLPFDWALRRVLTTTVNYFLLLSVPLPRLQPAMDAGKRLIDIAQTLHGEDASGAKTLLERQRLAELRAEADMIVLRAYGLGAHDLQVMLEDFPLLDRAQPPLPGETRSTVTRDLLLARAFEGHNDRAEWAIRLARALRRGAVAYEPSHLSGSEAHLQDVRIHG